MADVNLTLPLGTNGANGTSATNYGGTSTTSTLIGTGSKVFTTQASLPYLAGARVRASSNGDTTKWLEGIVTSYSGTSLTINSDKTNGAGTLTDWNFNIAGQPGTNGADGGGGSSGAAGSNGTGYTATSTTSITIGTGAQVFTTAQNVSTTAYAANQYIRATNDSTHYMEGTITSFTGTTLTMNVTSVVGSGAFAVWTFGIAGSIGQSGATYTQAYDTFTLNASNTFTGASSNRVQRANPAGITTSANRTITLLAGSNTDNFFSIIFPVQFTIGTGFTYKITQSGGSDLAILKEGTHPPRRYDCHYTGTTYVVNEYPIATPSATEQTYLTNKRFIVSTYDFATYGGAISTISLNEVIPTGAIIDANEVFIETTSPLTSGGSATVGVGIVGNTSLFDSPRIYSAYPYNGTSNTTRGESVGTATTLTNACAINKKSGVITSEALTTAAGASTTITLTNSFIKTTSRVLLTIGAYSGTLSTNGIPLVYLGTLANGSTTILVHNGHAANALNGTVTIHFQVLEERLIFSVTKVAAPTAVSVTIATATITAGSFKIFIPYTLDISSSFS